MSNVLSSIGTKFSIATSDTAVTGGTAAKALEYAAIPQIYECSLPDFTPNTIETTSFDNLENTSSIYGLSDGSAIYSLTARFSVNEDAETVWNAAAAAYDSGKYCYLKIAIRGAKSDFYLPIAPSETKLPGITLNDAISIVMSFTVTGDLMKAAVSG